MDTVPDTESVAGGAAANAARPGRLNKARSHPSSAGMAATMAGKAARRLLPGSLLTRGGWHWRDKSVSLRGGRRKVPAESSK